MYDDNDIEKSLQIMEVVEKELNRRKKEANFCFSIFLGATSVWVLLVELWRSMGQPLAAEYLTYGVEAIAVMMFIVTQVKTRLRIQDMGIWKKNLWPSLLRAAAISALIAIVMITAKVILKPGEPLFDMSRYGVTYPITSILQEFLARGFLLTCLMNIYDSPRKKHIAVILSSLLFTTLHLYYGFMFMVGAGILSVMLGYIYMKDENIWGVSLIHFVFGALGTTLSLV